MTEKEKTKYTGKCSLCGYEIPEGEKESVRKSLDEHENECHSDILDDLVHYFKGMEYTNMMFDEEAETPTKPHGYTIKCHICRMVGVEPDADRSLWDAQNMMYKHMEQFHKDIPDSMLLRHWDSESGVLSLTWLSETYSATCPEDGENLGIFDTEEETVDAYKNHMLLKHGKHVDGSMYYWDGPMLRGTSQEENVYGEKFDMVDNPQHYASGTLECKDWIRAMLTVEEYRGWLKGNALKYIWRYQDKGKPIQDISKARKYLEFLIDDLEREQVDIEEGTVWTV